MTSLSKKFDVLKQDILGSSMVSGVTGAQDELGGHLDQSGVEFKGDGPMRQLSSTRLIVDPDYLGLYKIPLVYGKDFSKEKSARGKEYILNETLANELLKDNPKADMSSLIGKHFGFDSLGLYCRHCERFLILIHCTIRSKRFFYSISRKGIISAIFRLKSNRAKPKKR